MNSIRSWLVPVYSNGTVSDLDGAIPCYYVRRKEKQQLIDYIAHKTYRKDSIIAIYEISSYDLKTRDLKDIAKYGKLVYKKEINSEASDK